MGSDTNLLDLGSKQPREIGYEEMTDSSAATSSSSSLLLKEKNQQHPMLLQQRQRRSSNRPITFLVCVLAPWCYYYSCCCCCLLPHYARVQAFTTIATRPFHSHHLPLSQSTSTTTTSTTRSLTLTRLFVRSTRKHKKTSSSSSYSQESSDNSNSNDNEDTTTTATTFFNSALQPNATYDFWEDALTPQTFNMDLANLASADPVQAQDALEIMYEMHQQQQQKQQNDNDTTMSDKNNKQQQQQQPLMTIEPDARCYATVIDGYVQAGNPAAAQQVLEIMDQRLLLANNNNNNKTLNFTHPMEQAYLWVAQAWADDTRGDFLGQSAANAEQLLTTLQERGISPDVKLWSVVLEGWCKRTGMSRIALQRADALLSEMEDAAAAAAVDGSGSSSANDNNDEQDDDYDEEEEEEEEESRATTTTTTTTTTTSSTDGASSSTTVPPPNIVTYTSYIGGLARSKQGDLARKAEATLVRMQQYGVTPDVVAYTSVLNCWSRAVSRREREMAASRALRILDEMERKYIVKHEYQVKPSHITYAAAIKAIGNSLDPKAPQLAEDVLRRMYQLSKSGTIANLKPTTSTWNAVLNALSRAPVTSTESKVRYARRAEQILAEMQQRCTTGKEPDVRPDVRTWAAVLRAWAMCGQASAAENAQRTLDKMEYLYETKQTHIRPNYVCYTTCMGAWGNSRRKDALDKLEVILRRMEQAYEETQEPDIRPNTISYVTAIDAFVRRDEYNAATRAQATVDRMMRLYSKGLGHVRPTKVVFNTLIHAWSKSRQKGAAVRAEKIFQWMETQAKQGDDLVRPDEVSLCAVLNAWANQAEDGGAKRAQQILDHMQSVPLERRGFHLSIMMPNIVIKAIARSGEKDAVRRAEAILQKLESDYIFDKSSLKPDVTTYSSVINCCAYYKHPEGQSEAIEVALRTFHKLCDLEDDGPNNVTFGTLFKAIANLMPIGDEREELVSDLFDQCCDLGHVDAFVLSQVRRASPTLYRNLVEEPCGLGGPNSDTSIQSVLQNIPQEWCAYCVD